MAQKTQNALQMAPETASQAAGSANEQSGSIRTATSLRDLVKGSEGLDVAKKAAFLGDIRQKLAQVADEARKHGEEATETENLAAASATRLYFARLGRDGVSISGDELTALLGDTFGYKPKADGTPGKQPDGPGRAIKSRIVRALQGYDYVHGGDGGRFFDTMSVDDVAPVINAIGRTKKDAKGDVVPDGPSVWTAYKLLGDIKSKGTVRVEAAFDPKKVAGLVDKLSEAGSRDKLINNPPLLKAYMALQDQLDIIMTVDASEADAIAQRLGNGAATAETEPEVETEGGEEVAA